MTKIITKRKRRKILMPFEIQRLIDMLLKKPKFAKYKDITGLIGPSREGGGLGWFMAIWVKPKSLLNENSYYRHLLSVLDCEGKTSYQITQDFNEKHGSKYKHPKEQGSISNYLTRLQVYGLAVAFKEKYALAPNADINDGPALFDKAWARASDLQKNAEKPKRKHL